MLEDVLRKIEAEHAKESVWIVGPETGRLLHFLVRVVAPKVAVEIGTSVGYSALWMASALKKNGEGQLWTVESHAERFQRATDHIQEAGLQDWITQVKGHAPEVFAQLEFPGPIDFTFFDATKMEHQSYLDTLYPLLAPGALVVVDNVQSHRFGHMQAFIEGLYNDPRFEVVEIPVGSGLLIARSTPEAK
jgi:predicted O-methyltransferase YrrM